MKCNFDGSCEESVLEESCGCDGNAYFASVTNYFQVYILSIHQICFNAYALKIKRWPNANLSFQDGKGTYGVGKRRRKRQSSDVCNNMQARCRDCRGDTARTAYAEKTDFDKYC